MSGHLLQRLAERDRLDALIAADVAEFDAAQLWDLDDATSMVAWLRDKARMTPREAKRLVTLAKKTSRLPVTHETWASGELSTGQVQTVLHHVGKKLGVFEEHEADLVPTLVPLSLLDTDTVMRAWRAKADAGDGGEPGDEVELPSTVQLSPVGDR